MIARRVARRLAQDWGWRSKPTINPGPSLHYNQQPTLRFDRKLARAWIREHIPNWELVQNRLAHAKVGNDFTRALQALPQWAENEVAWRQALNRCVVPIREAQYGWRKPPSGEPEAGWYVGDPVEGHGPFPSHDAALKAIKRSYIAYGDTDDVQQVPGGFKPYAGWGIWMHEGLHGDASNLFIEAEEGGPENFGYDRAWAQQLCDDMLADDPPTDPPRLEVRKL